MTELEIDVLAKKQHQRTIEDTMKVVREFFKELDSNRLKPIYPSTIPDDLVKKIQIIVPRLP